MTTLIKICGITTASDALAAADCGASFIGLIFAESSLRKLNLACAKEIVGALRKKMRDKVKVVGVFQNNSIDSVQKCADELQLDFVQFHGRESAEDCAKITKLVIKAIEIKTAVDAEAVKSYKTAAKYLLFDRPKSDNNDAWLAQAEASLSSQVNLPSYFFAGGLTAENVGEVVTKLKPFAIDVASSVEMRPGVKDTNKLRAFCQAVKEANALCNR
jgi:phosphoribosylanthranilate isomerase